MKLSCSFVKLFVEKFWILRNQGLLSFFYSQCFRISAELKTKHLEQQSDKQHCSFYFFRIVANKNKPKRLKGILFHVSCNMLSSFEIYLFQLLTNTIGSKEKKIFISTIPKKQWDDICISNVSYMVFLTKSNVHSYL